MNYNQYNFNFYFQIFITFLLLLFFQNCAVIKAPSGGPKDTTPPYLIEINPPSGSLNYKGEKIILKFSEYMNPKSIEKGIRIFPNITDELPILINGDMVTIDFPNDLDKNQTYVINLSRNIMDEHGVELADAIFLAYSTGKNISKGSISGIVYGERKSAVHLWKIKLAKIPLVQGQAEYSYATDSTNFPNDLDEVLEAYYRNNSEPTAPQDIALTKIDRSAYSQTPNKLAQGTPSQYYAQRKLNPSIFLYTTPSASVSDATTPSNYQFCFYYMARIQDTGAYTNTADVVNRFYPCMMSGLAYYLSLKFDPERTPALERTYESEMLRALDADNQGTSSFISPQTFYGDGV